MSLRKTKEIPIAEGRKVVAKEFTPTEVANLMDELDTYVPHLIDLLVEQDLPVTAVMLSTGLTEEELMATPPSVLNELFKGVRELNPSLAVLSERLKIIGEKAREMRLEKRPASS